VRSARSSRPSRSGLNQSESAASPAVGGRVYVADLASLYLGGIDAGRLHAAGRIEERTPGAVERAAFLFRTPLPPFCPEVF